MAHLFRDAALAEVMPPLQRWRAEDEARLVREYERLIDGIRNRPAAHAPAS